MQDQHSSHQMLRVKEVATRLDVHVSTVYRLVDSGRLRSARIGTGKGTVRIPKDSLESYLKSLGLVENTTTEEATA